MSLAQMADEDVIDRVTPLVEGMQSGFDNNDYTKFTENFGQELKQHMSKDEFARQRNIIFPETGKHTGIRFLQLHKGADDVFVIYYMDVEKGNPHLITYNFAEEGDVVKIKSARFF